MNWTSMQLLAIEHIDSTNRTFVFIELDKTNTKPYESLLTRESSIVIHTPILWSALYLHSAELLPSGHFLVGSKMLPGLRRWWSTSNSQRKSFYFLLLLLAMKEIS
jgi:hypothetical protein